MVRFVLEQGNNGLELFDQVEDLTIVELSARGGGLEVDSVHSRDIPVACLQHFRARNRWLSCLCQLVGCQNHHSRGRDGVIELEQICALKGTRDNKH